MRGKRSVAGVYKHVLRNGGRDLRQQDLDHLLNDGRYGAFKENEETELLNRKGVSYFLMGLFGAHGPVLLQRNSTDGFGGVRKGLTFYTGYWNLPWGKKDAAVFRVPTKK